MDQISLLFETSWEVCQKIGGIYTVLSTKARVLKEQFGNRLIFIGPDVWTKDNPSPYFIEKKTILRRAGSLNLPYDIKIRCGRWDIPGSPFVVLVDYKPLMSHLPEFYGKVWEEYGVDSLHAYGDYDESCAFAIASAIVIKELSAHLNASERGIVAHFDEWTTGMGLLWTKLILPRAATIFTTHATSIGRSICGNGKELYKYFHGYNGDQMARELNMESKHSLEKAAAWQADCFTTVSEVTAKECEQLLDRRPDVVTPNGFEPDFLPTAKRYAALRAEGRKRLLDIASKLCGRTLPSDTFLVATGGRNEYRNKGLDMFLDAATAFGTRMHDYKREAVALVLVPAWMREPNSALLVDMEDSTLPMGAPDYLTHRLNNEDSDSVACRIRSLQAEGRQHKVKIIYVPCYLDTKDGIVNIAYYDLLPALDAAVFPSYYEPWGYTPLESAAFGVPTLTTDKAGFGQWVVSDCGEGFAASGVHVVARDDDNYGACVADIADSLLTLARMTAKEIEAVRTSAAATARKADWKYFIEDYARAFETAISNADRRCE